MRAYFLCMCFGWIPFVEFKDDQLIRDHVIECKNWFYIVYP